MKVVGRSCTAWLVEVNGKSFARDNDVYPITDQQPTIVFSARDGDLLWTLSQSSLLLKLKKDLWRTLRYCKPTRLQNNCPPSSGQTSGYLKQKEDWPAPSVIVATKTKSCNIKNILSVVLQTFVEGGCKNELYHLLKTHLPSWQLWCHVINEPESFIFTDLNFLFGSLIPDLLVK